MSAAPGALPRVTRRRIDPLRITLLVAVALVVTSWGYILIGRGGSVIELFEARTWSRVADFLGALLGMETPISPGATRDRFWELDAWWRLARLAYDTLMMSILAIWFAAFGMLLTVMLGARPRSEERRVSAIRYGAFGLVRGVWIVARAVPELVWALLLVMIMPPGVLAGALALGIHNFGIVAKLCSEVVEDLDPRPARALRASGAGHAQTLLYAVLPQALPQFLTFCLYRWEVIIRTTIVVGFVAAGGLGREFRLAMSFFHYTDVTMILLTYFVLVIAVDLIAARLRALAR
jgi:phosphonate transport system permease protein